MKIIEKFRLNYFNRLILTINIVFLLIVYAVYLNKYFTPAEIPYLNFLSVGFPVLFLFIVIFLFYWLIISRKAFILILILSSGLFYPMYLSYPLINLSRKSLEKEDFSVLIYNVHAFKDEGTKELLVKNKADIILLQEGADWQQKTLIKNEFKDYYKEFYGLLTFYSKYPIIQTKEINFDDPKLNGKAAYADIDLGSDTIRFINAYLEPMYIDKELVRDIIKNDDTEIIKESSKKIELKLMEGMRKHEKQLKAIIPYITSSKYPVIFGSDLNATPLSYEYEQINNYLTDSYIEVGNGFATTFHGFKFPVRLDYLFHSKGLKPTESFIIRKRFSDHYPVVVKYKISK